MNRRETIGLIGATALAGVTGLPTIAQAAAPEMVVVVKIAGIPWFNALEAGVKKAGADLGINASMIGPAGVDPAQQVKLVEDLIAKKVAAIGIVPLDVAVLAPVLKRAQEAPEQDGRDWNIDLIDSVKFGEVQMEKLAAEMGGKGEYIAFVGTLTTPLHNVWCDAAIALQKAKFPDMKLVADRFPGADEIDTAQKTTLDAIKAYPNLAGVIAFGSNGPIGAGNAIRQQKLDKAIAVVGTALPSQAKPLIEAGIIREAFLWNPVDAGYAMVSLGKLVLDGGAIADGMEIPGVGKVQVDAANKLVKADKIMAINKDTVDGFIALGL
jgi:simple sugar transport system substrate-binding protein